ncbi:MAG TPA: NAD(P)-dependent oxidoreductase [Solirubrobacteraceae bacterium]|nr:NAD(P)-dependent oxidoreductase [Solirubrobacteraceae bacterium]
MSGPSVCVVGLGIMGRPVAATLARAGLPVRGWNRSPLAAGAPDGVELVASLADAAAADVVLMLLSDSRATGAVLDELEPYLRGATVLDMGSSDPADSRARAARLAARGVGWVDAPVSGGPDGAARAALAIMAGGEEPDFARVLPVLEVLGANVVRVGGPGAGHAMKVVNQVIVGLGIDAVAEALALAGSFGFSAEEVQAALRGGSADTYQLRVMGTRMGRREYVPGAKLTTVRKDLAMAAGAADAAGLELPHLRQALVACDEVVAAGSGHEDCAIVYELRAADGRLRGMGR